MGLFANNLLFFLVANLIGLSSSVDLPQNFQRQHRYLSIHPNPLTSPIFELSHILNMGTNDLARRKSNEANKCSPIQGENYGDQFSAFLEQTNKNKERYVAIYKRNKKRKEAGI